MGLYAKSVLRGLYVAVRMVLSGAFLCFLTASFSAAQQKPTNASRSDRILLGRMTNGAIVSFARTASGRWGIDVSLNNAPWMMQQGPAQIELFRGDGNVSDLAEGYKSVQKDAEGAKAKAIMAGPGGAEFAFTDRWRIAGDVVTLSRTLQRIVSYRVHSYV